MNRTARLLLVSRSLRALADGTVSVLLAGYLARLGFSTFEVGAIVTGTMLGSALCTIAVGLAAASLRVHRVLFGACALMVATGIGFASLTAFWPLFIVAVGGTLNPSSGDVSVFLPMEQTLVAGAAEGGARTTLFARYSLCGALAGAVGSLIGGFLARHDDAGSTAYERIAFLAYAGVGLVLALLYARLPNADDEAAATAPSDATRTSAHPTLAVNDTAHPTTAATGKPSARRATPLRKSRRVVWKLAALFSLDAFGGGFVVQSMLVVWLSQRFAMRADWVGSILFAAGVLGAGSQLLSPWVAARIGLVRTMVYTHLPANLFLVLAGLVDDAKLAILFLLLRAALQQMDVPARQSYVMSVVPPEERPAASSLTNVPRSLAAGLAPLLTGAMLAASSFGWPLVFGGVSKAVYDLLLLYLFGNSRPGDEA